MDLVDRYLASVRRNLPPAQAEDLTAELADELQNRIEDREARLGRPLTRAETSAMLREFGHPLVIAARYRPHQYLIGPSVFPFYRMVLKVVLATGIALVVGLATLSIVLADSEVVRAVTQAAHGLWSFFFLAVAIVTLVFAVLERCGFPADHLAHWRPEQLPEPGDGVTSQWNSAIEVGFGVAFVLWWTGLASIPTAMRGGVMIEAAPIWESFYLPILLLSLLQLLVSVVKWLRPRWKVVTSLANIGTALLTLAIIAGLQRAGTWVVVSASLRKGVDAEAVAHSVNLTVQITFAIIAIVMVLQILAELWKLLRPRVHRFA